MVGFKEWAVGIMVASSVVACGDDGDSKGGASGSAAHICTEQIACGYQSADQQTCTDLFQAFFTPAQIADCDACVTAEACATEQTTCMDTCSL